MFCPAGSSYFLTCDAGYYCNHDSNYQEIICPQNYYCPRGTGSPVPCTGRYICPEGSILPEFCDAGNYIIYGDAGFMNACVGCTPGTYSTVMDDTCKDCEAGYLCYGSTNKRYPSIFNRDHGEICPKGYYCPSGSSEGTACPAGTYNPSYGGRTIADCLLCEPNTFNSDIGQVGCRPCGAYASSG